MASIGSKREWDVSEIEESKDVIVHGIPLQVSPVKESKSNKGVRYFDASISDGKKSRRVVSFDASLQPAIKKAEEEKSVVALMNSTVKKNSLSYKLEVHLNKSSKVVGSTREMNVGQVEATSMAAPREVKIADIVDTVVNQAVDVTCKV